MRTNTSKGYKEIIGKKRNQRHKESLRLYAWVDHFRHWPVAIILIATIFFRTLNIISVAADGRQTEELLISGHNVAVRWRSLLRRPALSTKFSAGWSIWVSHAPRAHVYHCVDWCLRLVYQPADLSSCSRCLIGMDIVFFNMVLPGVRLSQFLPGAFKSPLKSQTFVQIQGRFHFLLKSHAALQHHKYIDHPCQWRLCQKRRGLREVQWTAVPLTPDLLRGYQAHLSLWFSPRTA